MSTEEWTNLVLSRGANQHNNSLHTTLPLRYPYVFFGCSLILQPLFRPSFLSTFSYVGGSVSGLTGFFTGREFFTLSFFSFDTDLFPFRILFFFFIAPFGSPTVGYFSPLFSELQS